MKRKFCVTLLIICGLGFQFFLISSAGNDTINIYDLNEQQTAIQAINELYSGNPENAYILINEAIKVEPNAPQLYNTRALVRGALHDYYGAFDDYAHAIFLAMDYPTPYYNRANLLRDLGQYQKALSDYNAAIAFNFKGGGAYINRGYVKLEQLQDIEGAFSDFDTAIKSGDESEGAYYGRAVCNYHKGYYEKTISDATKAILLNYKNPDAYLIRGQAKIKLKQIQSGLQDLQWAEQQYNQLLDTSGAKKAKDLYIYYSRKGS